MSATPLISVVIPAYNAAVFLPTALDSIFVQTYERVEIIVVDDGSDDATPEVVDRYADRVRYIHQANSGGPAKPRNVGIAAATGDYVALFDADDVMEPEKLARSYQALEQTDADFVFSDFSAIDESGQPLGGRFLDSYREFRKRLQPSRDCAAISFLAGRTAYRELLTANFIGTSSVVCRRSVLLDAGGFDEVMHNADDIDMWRRIAVAGHGFAYIDEPLHRYRKRPGGVTGRGVKRYPAILYGLNKQLAFDLDTAERRILVSRISQTRSGYAEELRRAGEWRAAQAQYREMLRAGAVRSTLKGLVKLAVGRVWYRS